MAAGGKSKAALLAPTAAAPAMDVNFLTFGGECVERTIESMEKEGLGFSEMEWIGKRSEH